MGFTMGFTTMFDCHRVATFQIPDRNQTLKPWNILKQHSATQPDFVQLQRLKPDQTYSAWPMEVVTYNN